MTTILGKVWEGHKASIVDIVFSLEQVVAQTPEKKECRKVCSSREG